MQNESETLSTLQRVLQRLPLARLGRALSAPRGPRARVCSSSPSDPCSGVSSSRRSLRRPQSQYNRSPRSYWQPRHGPYALVPAITSHSSGQRASSVKWARVSVHISTRRGFVSARASASPYVYTPWSPPRPSFDSTTRASVFDTRTVLLISHGA